MKCMKLSMSTAEATSSTAVVVIVGATTGWLQQHAGLGAVQACKRLQKG